MSDKKKNRLITADIHDSTPQSEQEMTPDITYDAPASYGLAPSNDIATPDPSEDEWELFCSCLRQERGAEPRADTLTYDIDADIVETFKMLNINSTRVCMINSCLRAFLLHHKERFMRYVIKRPTVF